MTYLTKHGLISPKLQLLSGHTAEQSLAVYRALALSDVATSMKRRCNTFRCDKGQMGSYRTFPPVGPSRRP